MSLCVPFVSKPTTLDYESDSLDRNLLQLSSPSTVLFDETRLNPGQLTNIGVSNLQVLHKVLATSQLEYDFKYQSLGFDIDWSIMFISSNVKTLLQQDGAGQHGIDLTLRLAPKSTKQLYGLKTDEQQQQQPTSQQLDYWRAYLLLARQSTFQIAPTMSKVRTRHTHAHTKESHFGHASCLFGCESHADYLPFSLSPSLPLSLPVYRGSFRVPS